MGAQFALAGGLEIQYLQDQMSPASSRLTVQERRAARRYLARRYLAGAYDLAALRELIAILGLGDEDGSADHVQSE